MKKSLLAVSYISFALLLHYLAYHVKCSSQFEKVIKVGPNGDCYNVHKHQMDVWDDKGKSGVCRIYISHSERDGVRSIQIAYAAGTLSAKHGGNGYMFDTITIDYPTEFIVGIKGHYDSTISSISFVTNKRVYGPFGASEGFFSTKYSMTFAPGEFFGLHGYSTSNALCGIGAYVKPYIRLSQSHRTMSTRIQV